MDGHPIKNMYGSEIYRARKDPVLQKPVRLLGSAPEKVWLSGTQREPGGFPVWIWTYLDQCF